MSYAKHAQWTINDNIIQFTSLSISMKKLEQILWISDCFLQYMMMIGLWVWEWLAGDINYKDHWKLWLGWCCEEKTSMLSSCPDRYPSLLSSLRCFPITPQIKSRPRDYLAVSSCNFEIFPSLYFSYLCPRPVEEGSCSCYQTSLQDNLFH